MNDSEMIAHLTSRNTELHDALQQALVMLRFIRDGGSMPAMEYHLKLASLEKALFAL